MQVFKRNRTKEDTLKDKFINSFYKTGFVNDNLIFNEYDRDFFNHFLHLLADPNASSIFEAVLVGYQEVPYKESIIQKALLRQYKDAILHRTGDQVYASTTINNFKIYRCLFVYSPINFMNNSKGIQIRNTIEKIKNVYQHEFKIIPSVLRFLEEQSKIHMYNKDEMQDHDKDLFLKDIVTLIVPMLEDGTHYNINGMLRYPYVIDRYHNTKSQLGQIKLTFRAKYKRNYSKYTAYFDSGFYKDKEGVEKEIFYIKFFNKYCNPFFAFDKDEIDDLMKDLYTYDLSKKTRTVLENTYEMYMNNIDKLREKSANVVPYINIYKKDDSYYLNRDKAVDELNDILSTDGGEDDDDDDIGEVDLVDNNIEEDEEELARLENQSIEEFNATSRQFRVTRQAVSIPIIKSLILGYNGKLFYGLYSHLGDNLLKITDINNSGFNGKDNGMISNKHAPKALQVIMTISSNADLFMTNTDSHPFDIFNLFSYKKYFHERDTNPNRKDKGGRGGIPLEERFLKLDGSYGIIDSSSTKSESNSGISGFISTLSIYDKYFEYTHPEEDNK